jgi:hypothetical protein
MRQNRVEIRYQLRRISRSIGEKWANWGGEAGLQYWKLDWWHPYHWMNERMRNYSMTLGIGLREWWEGFQLGLIVRNNDSGLSWIIDCLDSWRKAQAQEKGKQVNGINGWRTCLGPGLSSGGRSHRGIHNQSDSSAVPLKNALRMFVSYRMYLKKGFVCSSRSCISPKYIYILNQSPFMVPSHFIGRHSLTVSSLMN